MHSRNISSVLVTKISRQDIARIQSVSRLEDRGSSRVINLSRNQCLTKDDALVRSGDHRLGNDFVSFAHVLNVPVHRTQTANHRTAEKIDTDNISKHYEQTNPNLSSAKRLTKQLLRLSPSALSFHSIKSSRVTPVSGDQSSPLHALCSSKAYRSIQGINQVDISDATEKQKQDSLKKSRSKYDNQPRLPELNIQRQKQKKFLCCPCSPLCAFLSLLGTIMFGAILAALLVGLLLPKLTGTTTTSTGSTIIVTTTTKTTATSITTTATTTAVCNPICLNGGTCIPTNTCLCIPDVWIGSQCQTPVRILWTFDNHLDDFYGNFPGVGVNSPNFGFPGINGYGSCAYLNASAQQSITIFSPPFLNMAYTSFSLSAWVKANSFRTGCPFCCTGDNAIFGQHDQQLTDRSLHIIVRSQSIYLGFYTDDTQGSLVLQSNIWYHMAYVYDYATRTQFVYVNGQLDAMRSPAGPYKGITGNLTIGTNGVCSGQNYWDGCIDQVSYFSRAKNASEVLRDATLTVSYPFSNNLLDNGPLGINGTGLNVQYTASGRAGQGIDLSVTSSYVQAAGLVYLGTDSHPYSVSIWIRPAMITSGTIVHVSSGTVSIPWSMPMLGFTSAGNVGVQGCTTMSAISLTGPTVPVGVWTHLAVTYSLANRLRLWVNGTQFGSPSASFSSATIDAPVTITLGSSVGNTSVCSAGVINSGQYSGFIDEFRLFSRELSSADISNLFTNPQTSW